MEVISHAVWLYFRFPLGLRMVEEMLAARGIAAGDKWHLDEVVLKIAGVTHWLWRAVDQTASFSTFWSRADATNMPRSGCCASFCGGRVERLA